MAATKTSYGEEHTAYASAINWLATLLEDTDQLVKAERLYRLALSIYEQNFGPDHPAVAKELTKLGH